jgi:hypothetical protein
MRVNLIYAYIGMILKLFLLNQKKQKVIPNRDLYGYGYDAYFITDNQELLEKEFRSAGANIVRPLHNTDYHNFEFVVEDIDRRWIGFGIKKSNSNIIVSYG